MSTVFGISQTKALDLSAQVHGPRLAGLSRQIGIAAWALIWLTSLAAFFMAIYLWNLWDRIPGSEVLHYLPITNTEGLQARIDFQNTIRDAGLTLPLYADFFVILRLISGTPYFILSILIIWRRSDRLMAVLFAMFLGVAGAAGRWLIPNWDILPGLYPWTSYAVQILSFILGCSTLLFYTFPDGRFVPRWTLWLALFVVLYNFLKYFTGDSFLNPDNYPGLLPVLPNGILMALGIYALVYRYRRDADAVQKQQIKWIAFGSVMLGMIYLQQYLTNDIYYALTGGDTLWKTQMQLLVYELITEPFWYVAQFVFAVCIGISLFRYRLWDIDLVINRVLVYGSLTLLTMGVYLATVAALGWVFRGIADRVVFFLATGSVAILFEPLRLRLQRLVNRFMYGYRDDPYAVLTRLSNALESTPSMHETLPLLARTIGSALKIPYVAIRLDRDGEERLAAAHGSPREDLVVSPLVYQGEIVGSLQLARRDKGEEFSSADLRLIENIAHQAGTAAQAVRLNGELLRSRTQIVTEREEERLRMRRDLHDELGPILASQSLKMAAVRQLIRQAPEKAEEMVEDIIHQNERTLAEVRRLVHGLRPPALDELGLVEAIRDLVNQTGGEGLEGRVLEIQVSGPEDGLPNLPAAVEANAYRIALEALANVVRHAQATRCSVNFRYEAEGSQQPALVIQISDDGTGLPANFRAGVGLRSMRERAEEIGGHLIIEPGQDRGTRVTAWLPVSIS